MNLQHSCCEQNQTLGDDTLKKIILTALMAIFLLNGCNSEDPSLLDTDSGSVYTPAGNEVTAPFAYAGNDQTVAHDETVTLSASGSSAYTGSAVIYEWKTGSTVLSNESSFSISTLLPGTYSIVLTITDDIGVTSSDTVVVKVVPNASPTADAGDDQTIAHDGVTHLNASGSSDSDGTISSYEWKIQDHILSTESSFSISTLLIGEYTITLSVTDNDGVTDTDTVIVNILPNSSPTANAGSNQNIVPGGTVSLNASGSSDSDGTIVSYQWKDGSTILSTKSSFSTDGFSTGTHTITLTVTDDDGATGTDTVIVNVTTNSAPTANAGTDKTVTYGSSVYLSASGSSDSDGTIVSYEWKDGTTLLSTKSSFYISTLTTKTHTITLTVTDDDGSTGTDTVLVNVSAGNVSPTASAGIDRTVAYGEKVYFYSTGSSDEDGTIASYKWKEGTTTLSYSSTFSTTTLSKGTHTITLTVTDNDGATDTDTVVITVDYKPSATNLTFTTSVDTQIAIKTSYNYNSGSAIDRVFWKIISPSGKTYTKDFDTSYNGYNYYETLTLKYADEDVFDQDGTYTVETYVTNLNGLVSTTHSETVYITLPYQSETITHNSLTYKTVKSSNTSKIWLDRNLGATTICGYYNDSSCYGDYYQWGRDRDGHEKSYSLTTSVQATDVTNAGSRFIFDSTKTYNYDWAKNADSDGTLRSFNWSKTDATTVCPVGYRVPTITEVKAETVDAGLTNRDGAVNSFLKLPTAGYRAANTGTLSSQATWGYLWSSSTDSVSGGAQTIEFSSTSLKVVTNLGRAGGNPVRCIKD